MTKLINSKLILASKSKWRAQMLKNAGIDVECIPADIDERQIEEPLVESGLDGSEIATVLAISKAQAINPPNGNSIVIGSDQTLTLDEELLHKTANIEEAQRRLLALSGQTHHLNSAVALVQNGETIWQFSDTAAITIRKLSPEFIGQHLARAGDQVLGSVGAYQIEGEGVQLFDKIDGDFFTIMGLPLLPLIKQLRRIGYLDD